MRLRLDISYDGTDFSGWARQPGLRTVCGEIEEKMSLVLREPVQLTVAGRTDAGVHSTGQVVHVDISPQSLETRSLAGNPRNLLPRLAKLLPNDVRVREISLAPTGFDARFSALRRHYSYRLTDAAWGADPLRARDTATWRRQLDVEQMNRAAEQLLGLNNFAAFCKYREGATTIRELQKFHWQRDGDVLTATVIADAFCWSMVRSLVGATAAIGEGTRDLAWGATLLTKKERVAEVPVAPACGLTLVQVDYPADDLLATRAELTRNVRDCC